MSTLNILDLKDSLHSPPHVGCVRVRTPPRTLNAPQCPWRGAANESLWTHTLPPTSTDLPPHFPLGCLPAPATKDSRFTDGVYDRPEFGRTFSRTWMAHEVGVFILRSFFLSCITSTENLYYVSPHLKEPFTMSV